MNDGNPLGKKVAYDGDYDSKLLFAIDRSDKRRELGLGDTIPFQGVDVWHGYELSWLSSKGKPEVRMVRIVVPCTSPNIVESKSLKLYFNGFNQQRFDSEMQVKQLIERDLSECVSSEISVEFFSVTEAIQQGDLPGKCIDDQDVVINEYQVNANLLSTEQETVEETLHSHLLRSNCLITNQPDWASVVVAYQGTRIVRSSLLCYLVSFRQHNEFHEQCVERIFIDIMAQCQPQKLAVHALFTRRGGIDINPYRSNYPVPYQFARSFRQ